MSAPFKATAGDLEALAAFLRGLTTLTQETGVSLYMPTDVELPGEGSTVSITRKDVAPVEGSASVYVVDDRIGS